MAKKLLLDATSKPQSTYKDWTATYRQSTNIIDQRDGVRGKTPTDTTDGSLGWSGTADTTPLSTSSSTTRKVSPEEAVQNTYSRRK